jgi:hypothetical protein
MNEAALGSLKLHFGSMGSRLTERLHEFFLRDPELIAQLKCSHTERKRERESGTHTHTLELRVPLSGKCFISKRASN